MLFKVFVEPYLLIFVVNLRKLYGDVLCVRLAHIFRHISHRGAFFLESPWYPVVQLGWVESCSTIKSPASIQLKITSLATWVGQAQWVNIAGNFVSILLIFLNEALHIIVQPPAPTCKTPERSNWHNAVYLRSCLLAESIVADPLPPGTPASAAKVA